MPGPWRPSWVGLALMLLSVASLGRVEAQTSAWSQFRGPTADGVAQGSGFPDTWSTTENVVWVTEVPGRGWSSPIVWGRQVFVTSAVSAGSFMTPSTGIFGMELYNEALREGLSAEEAMARVSARDVETTTPDSPPVRRMLYCFDAETGEVLWERQVHLGVAPGGRHRKNTCATETPITDGQRVHVYFGNIGLYVYSMDGDLMWSRAFDPHPVYFDFGPGASPGLDDEHVYVLNDNERRPFLTALDKTTGAEVWTAERGDVKVAAASGWATPFVWKNTRRTEIHDRSGTRDQLRHARTGAVASRRTGGASHSHTGGGG